MDDGTRFAVVQVRAGAKVDGIEADGFIEVFDEHGVGPRLIRWVTHFSLSTADKGTDDRVLASGRGFLPLLEFDDDRGALPVVVGAGEDHVDPLAGLRDVVFDCDAGVLGYVWIIENPVHVRQGIPPCGKLAITHRATEYAFERGEDLLLDPVGEDVGLELSFGGEVNDHFIRFG